MYSMDYMVPGVVLILGILSLAICSKKKKKGATKIVAVIFSLAFVGTVAYTFMGKGGGEEVQQDTTAFKAKYYQAVGNVIGNEVTGKCLVAKRALVIAPPKYLKDKVQMALVDELSDTIGSITEKPLVDYVRSKRPKDPYLASHFNYFLRKHESCDLIVSIIGLPDDLKLISAWQKPEGKRPKFIIFTDTDKVKKFGDLLDFKMIQALVCRKPGDKSALDDVPPEDLKSAFKKHFIMITPGNYKEMQERYKDLF